MLRIKNKKAFAIVELIIVIAIIAILMGTAFVGGSALTERSRTVSIESQLGNFNDCLTEMLLDNSQLALVTDLDAQTLTAGISNREHIVNLINSYLGAENCSFTITTEDSVQVIKSNVTDPYGNPFQMYISSQNVLGKTELRIYIKSSGKNKQTVIGYADRDDVFLMVECVNSSVRSTVVDDIDFGSANDEATAENGQVIFTTSVYSTGHAMLNGAHTVF